MFRFELLSILLVHVSMYYRSLNSQIAIEPQTMMSQSQTALESHCVNGAYELTVDNMR